MDSWVYIALLFLMFGFIGVIALFKEKAGQAFALVPKRLMTAREREAIVILEQLLPNCRIHSQVAMSAVLTTARGLEKKKRISLRNRFDRKIIDFVVEHRATGDIAFLVELDDSMHDATKDSARDELTGAAGYRTVRIPPRTKLDRDALGPLLLNAGNAEDQSR